MRTAVLSLLLFIVLPAVSRCVPASPAGVRALQPDGTSITIFSRGDEFHHWNEDGQGYTILKDTATQAWLYAEKDTRGALKATGHKVGAGDPAALNLKKHLADASRLSSARALRSGWRVRARWWPLRPMDCSPGLPRRHLPMTAFQTSL